MLPLTPMRIFTEARLDEGEHAAEEVLAEVRERRRPKRLARWWRLQGFLLKPPKESHRDCDDNGDGVDDARGWSPDRLATWWRPRSFRMGRQ